MLIMIKEPAVKCPHCGEEIEVNPASIMGSKKSEAKTAAVRENAKKPRPNAQGKPKPRKPKAAVQE